MTPFFPGWHLPTLRRKPKSDAQKLLESKEAIHRKSFNQLNQCLAKYIPASLFQNTPSSAFSRRRIFTLENTFWAFFQQVLSADGGCKEIVNQFRVMAEQRNFQPLSSSTSAYCQARKKLSDTLLSRIFEHTQTGKDSLSKLPLINRRVVVADGTGVTMPDTPENQTCWPQLSSQKEGCGFPQGRICALFNLHNGANLSFRMGNKKSHELPLFREQLETFREGDVFLGDKGFVCYFDMLTLKGKGVDSVVALARRKPVTASHAKKVLSEHDLLIEWGKPKSSKPRYPEDQWQAIAESILVRQIKVNVEQPGFRVKSFYIVTTLLDEKAYPAHIIAELYRKRWDVELYFRELKITLGMDILRCKTPDMVQKEVMMYFIVFNVLKRIMFDSAKQSVSSNNMSFNECRQTLNSFVASIYHYSYEACIKINLVHELQKLVKDCIIVKRSGRVEPRVRKRRPKPFKLMTKPRQVLRAELLGQNQCVMALT